ncbi:MAG: ATP synthase F0 subunit B [Myxococcales bacterium]|nr:ATP synthase F0 subunit B [Myxococcales bacterium]
MVKSRLRQLIGTFGPLLVTMTLAADAWASPEGGEHGGEHHGLTLFNWPSDADPRIGLVWLLINFFALVYLLYKLIIKNLIASNHERHDTIRTELEQATAAQASAKAIVSEFEAKLETFESERRQLLDLAREGAERDRKRIVAEAEAEAEKILAAAKATAEREAEARRQQVEAEIVGKAIERARELLLNQFNDADQRRLVDGYATDVANKTIEGGV